MSSSPIQYQINQKRRAIDVLGREIDSTVQNVMKNESRYTPLKAASKYIINDMAQIPKYNIIQGRVEPLPEKDSEVIDYPQQGRNNPQQGKGYFNQIEPQRSTTINYQPVEPYPYSQMKYPVEQRLNYYPDRINSKNELISRMQHPNSYSMSYINQSRYENNDNEYNRRYANNHNESYSLRRSEDTPQGNKQGSAYYYSYNLPQGRGLKEVPSNVYIPSYQPYKPLATPENQRADYEKSRFGDYTYNYYLNSPMRANITEDWKYPPQYYYNSRYDPRTYYHFNY